MSSEQAVEAAIVPTAITDIASHRIVIYIKSAVRVSVEIKKQKSSQLGYKKGSGLKERKQFFIRAREQEKHHEYTRVVTLASPKGNVIPHPHLHLHISINPEHRASTQYTHTPNAQNIRRNEERTIIFPDLRRLPHNTHRQISPLDATLKIDF